MGYESRLHIVERVECKTEGKKPYIYGMEVARFDLCKIGYEFHGLFNTPIDFQLDGDFEADLTEDMYGEHCRYTDVQTVINWLEQEVERDDYRRLKPLLGLLKGFDLSEWNISKDEHSQQLIIVHYGH